MYIGGEFYVVMRTAVAFWRLMFMDINCRLSLITCRMHEVPENVREGSKSKGMQMYQVARLCWCR